MKTFALVITNEDSNVQPEVHIFKGLTPYEAISKSLTADPGLIYNVLSAFDVIPEGIFDETTFISFESPECSDKINRRMLNWNYVPNYVIVELHQPALQVYKVHNYLYTVSDETVEANDLFLINVNQAVSGPYICFKNDGEVYPFGFNGVPINCECTKKIVSSQFISQ